MLHAAKKAISEANKALGRVTGYRLARAEDVSLTSRSFINKNLRENSRFLKGDVLELGTAPASWLRKEFGHTCRLKTFDQTPSEYVDIVGDLMRLTERVPAESFDAVVCTEVMEHVARPFDAVKEIYKALKPGGVLLASAPFVHDLHGENYGDYWRITRQGWRELLSEFKKVEVAWLGNEMRPKHYFVIAIK